MAALFSDFVHSGGAVAGGIVLLVASGEMLVKHAVHLAVSCRVPKTVVGAVVLGFGTSLPELLVSVTAAVGGSPGIAIGNVVGSNIANVGLVLGLGALLMTLHVERPVLRADLPLGILAALLLILWVGPTNEVSRPAGAVLLGGFAFYLWLSLDRTRRHRALQTAAAAPLEKRLLVDAMWIVGGLIGLAAGARILVNGAAEAARLLEVSERVIGLSVVALGTSLPELTAMCVAARKGETDLAVGNVAGSNLFNILFVLATTALVHPIPVEAAMGRFDFPVLAVFSVLAFPLLASARRIGRRQGLILLVAYAAYMAWTWRSA